MHSLHALVAKMNIGSAKSEAKMLVRNMMEGISGRTAAAVMAEVPDHHQCRFARWHEGIGRDSFAHLPAFQEIDGPLASLYRTAQSLRAALQAADRDEALRQGADLSRIEQEFVSKLDALGAAVSPKQN